MTKNLKKEIAGLGQTVLVFQGGGALGAYQIGVYQALHEAGIEPDWVIGTSIGCRFVNIPVMRVLKVLMVSAGATCFMLALAVAAALGVEAATGLPFPALWLAFAPGGLAEMTLISLAMGIDTAFVSTHHLLRVVFMVTAAPLVFALIRKRLS